mgnify:CR=1 FL=1
MSSDSDITINESWFYKIKMELVHRFRNNYTIHLSANLIAQA